MNKDNLVSIDWVLNKLQLSELPKKHSYDIIANYIINGCFEMYFDESIVGTDATVDVEMVFDENERLTGGLIGNGHSIEHRGTKVAAGVDVYHSNGKYQFAVNDYYFHEERFYPTDSEGVWHRPKLVDVELVYFDKNQINSFVPPKNFSRAKGDQGPLKALALLARDLAENGGSKFKTGNKVNASQFKEYILELAEKHEISEGYLRSLGDKVSKVLKELDLNDIPPDKK